MRIRIKRLFLSVALLAGLGLVSAGRAQTFSNLHSFSAVSTNMPHTNSEGANPFAGLILSGNMLYGTAQNGGTGGSGSVFGVNTDGSAFTNLHSFAANPSPAFTNSDGALPFGSLALAGGTLYGTAEDGGSGGTGTVFALGTNGSNFTSLYFFTRDVGASFTNSDGAFPFDGLVLSGGTLYGAANGGGTLGGGSLFALQTNGTLFTNLHSFAPAPLPTPTNNGGAYPIASLLLAGNTLYGTAELGGTNGSGTLFQINPDGTGFTNFYVFSQLSFSTATNGDGANPVGGLMMSGNTLYGTGQAGGTFGKGTVFAVNADGSGFTNLHNFTGTDGAAPEGTLILSSNVLYGTTLSGGGASNGTVFAVNTDGTGFTNLHTFTALSGTLHTNSDGGNPAGTLLMSGNILYGTTQTGGASGTGALFAITLGGSTPPPPPPPQLTITAVDTNVILTWPAVPGGFTLESNANPGVSTVWGPVSPAPTVIAGTNTVTNAVSTTQMFYRLGQ